MMESERFIGIERLYGKAGANRLRESRAAVIGIGGVGSWAAEALARSGVGTIIMLDLDDLCITNTNRQIHAIDGCIGRVKVDVMAERIHLINPQANVIAIPSFYTVAHPERLFDTHPDVVIDAIDSMRPKCHLIAECRTRRIPIVTCGGAGGRIDPASIAVADLARSCGDNMLSQLRKTLRKDYGFPLYDRCPDIGIPCVYSPEKPRFARCDGTVSCEREPGQRGGITCHAGFGSATHITGTFGLIMAGLAVNILEKRDASPVRTAPSDATQPPDAGQMPPGAPQHEA